MIYTKKKKPTLASDFRSITFKTKYFVYKIN